MLNKRGASPLGGPESKDVACTFERESLTPRAFKACTVSRSSELDSSALLWCASWITGIPGHYRMTGVIRGQLCALKALSEARTPRSLGPQARKDRVAAENFTVSQCRSYCSPLWWLLWYTLTASRSIVREDITELSQGHILTTASRCTRGTRCTWCSYTETSAGAWALLQPVSTTALSSRLTSSSAWSLKVKHALALTFFTYFECKIKSNQLHFFSSSFSLFYSTCTYCVLVIQGNYTG